MAAASGCAGCGGEADWLWFVCGSGVALSWQRRSTAGARDFVQYAHVFIVCVCVLLLPEQQILPVQQCRSYAACCHLPSFLLLRLPACRLQRGWPGQELVQLRDWAATAVSCGAVLGVLMLALLARPLATLAVGSLPHRPIITDVPASNFRPAALLPARDPCAQHTAQHSTPENAALCASTQIGPRLQTYPNNIVCSTAATVIWATNVLLPSGSCTLSVNFHQALTVTSRTGSTLQSSHDPAVANPSSRHTHPGSGRCSVADP